MADARLCIVEARAHAIVGNADEAKLALTAAREAAYEGELPDGSGTIAEGITLARATFLLSDVGAMLTAARSAYETETRRRSAWYPTAAMNLGWALIMAGATEEAIPPLEKAIALESRHMQWVVAGAARCLLAETSLTAGHLAEADRLIGEALELARTRGFGDLPHVGYYHVILGALHARRGELDDADAELGLGLKMMGGHWEPLMTAKALLERALVRRSLGALTEARAMLAEARAIIESCADPSELVQRIEEVTRKLRPAQTRSAADDGLTERELDVLRLLADGFTKREVGARLFLSYSTIHSHTKSIYRKLDSNSRKKVLERARELGLIGPG
jgi:LuxR family maltose regulon positive regulatory protein